MDSAVLKITMNLASLAVAAALALCFSLSPPPEDAFFEHLTRGRLILEQGDFPQSEPFYFSTPEGTPFSKNDWLFDLASIGLWKLSGGSLPALGLARSLLLLLGFAFLLASGFRRRANPFSSAAFALWALYAALPFTGHSPTALGLPLFAFCLYLMEGPFWPALFSRWVWLAPLLALWVNLQSGAVLFLAFSWTWAWTSNGQAEGRPALAGFSRLALLLLLSLCALLHPLLWRVLPAGLDLTLRHAFEPGAFEACRFGLLMLAGALLCLLTSGLVPGGARALRRDGWLFALLAPAALLWRDLLPYACLWAAPMAARRLDLCLDALGRSLTLARLAFRAALLALGLLWLFRLGASPLPQVPRGPRPAQLPRETFAFFKSEGLQGNLFTEPDWSGRALWELAPAAKVFGRTRLFGKPAREELLLERGADFALLPPGTPLAKAMARSAQWQPVDFDGASVLYARTIPENASLIRTHAPRGLRPGDPADPFEDSRLPQVEADLETRLNQRPRSGVLHYFQAKLWLRRGKPALARQWLERGLRGDPAYAPNYRLLSELLLKAGDPAGARGLMEKAAALEAW